MLTLILYTQKQVKLTTFALSVIAGLGVIIISSSKGPLLGLVITIVLFAPIIFSNLKVFITTVSLFLITQIYLSSYEQYNAFIVRLLNTSADQSTSIRLNIYNEASNAFSNNPIIGEGVGFFSDYYPHNVVLEFLSEGGLLLGSFLIVFLVWLVWTFFRSFNSIRNPLFVCGIALTILSFCVLMVSFTYTDLKFLYLGVGVSLQFLTLYEKSKSDYKNSL
ncbi:O-antigen ligase family protein [Bacillus sp. JCM 19041]|uniref:O-antigen ligase family protein n=1 Tax=Bacillus sp. JCM 19041 TaxID=1460637 RepID=UPI0018D0BA59